MATIAASAGPSYFEKQFEVTLQAEVIQTLRTSVLKLNREREELREFVSALLQSSNTAFPNGSRRVMVMMKLSEPTVVNHCSSFELTSSLDALARFRARIAEVNSELKALDERLKKELTNLTQMEPDWAANPEIAFLLKPSA